jgi:hypothetical protein
MVDYVILNAYTTATADIKDSQPLNIQCERNYNFGPVTFNRNEVMLSGRPDYSVWYGDNLCLSVLVVKGTPGVKGINPITQLLGYMGMYFAICVIVYLRKLIRMKGCVHREQKAEKKRNCGVYGMAYAWSTWHFLKIGHDSKVS